MSQWTHVAGMIRLDGLLLSEEQVEGVNTALDEDVPSGSEGPLQFGLIPGGESHLNFAQVAIWGDLRDYDSTLPIIDWLNRSTAKLKKAGAWVRQAAITIGIEGQDEVHLHYVEEQFKVYKGPVQEAESPYNSLL